MVSHGVRAIMGLWTMLARKALTAATPVQEPITLSSSMVVAVETLLLRGTIKAACRFTTASVRVTQTTDAMQSKSTAAFVTQECVVQHATISMALAEDPCTMGGASQMVIRSATGKA